MPDVPFRSIYGANLVFSFLTDKRLHFFHLVTFFSLLLDVSRLWKEKIFCLPSGKYPLQKKSKSAGRNRLVVNISNLTVTYLRGGAFLQERKEGGNFAGEIIKTVTL